MRFGFPIALRLWHLSDEGADKGIGIKQFKQISSLSKKLM